MCVIHEQGNIALEERCDGLEEGFDGDVTRLQVTGDADPTTSQQETVAALQADESIDAILAAGPVQAIVAVEAVGEVGRGIMIGNFDMSGDVIDAIENGSIPFAIDQQQYLQGYLPVVFMYLQATNFNTAGGGQPILTGPGFVTQETPWKSGDRRSRYVRGRWASCPDEESPPERAAPRRRRGRPLGLGFDSGGARHRRRCDQRSGPTG